MFIEDEKVKVAWNLPRALLPKNRVKLLLDMVLVAAQTIPRGGILVVEGDGPAPAMTFRIASRGLNARIPRRSRACSPVLPKAAMWTPMAFSHIIRACWPAFTVPVWIPASPSSQRINPP